MAGIEDFMAANGDEPADDTPPVILAPARKRRPTVQADPETVDGTDPDHEPVLDLDAYIDETDPAVKDTMIRAATKWVDGSARISYGGHTLRVRPGVNMQVAFAPQVRVGDNTELTIMIVKEDRPKFGETFADDDRFLFNNEPGNSDVVAEKWVDLRSVLQTLAMGTGANPKG